jgi:hypothetical protein
MCNSLFRFLYFIYLPQQEFPLLYIFQKKNCLGLKGLVVVVVVLLLSIYGDISYLLMYKMNMSTYLIYFYIPFRII